jgi:fibronectin-binding autotransporter adhesin
MSVILYKAKLGLEDLFTDTGSHDVLTSDGTTTRSVTGLAGTGGFLPLAGGTVTGATTFFNADMTLSGTTKLVVGGTTTINGLVFVNDVLTVANSGGVAIDATGTVDITGTLSASGLATLGGGVTTGGSGTLAVGGTTTLSAGMTGTTATFSGNVGITGTGTLTVAGLVTMSGAATVGTTLGVTGAVTLDSTLSAGACTFTTVGIAGQTADATYKLATSTLKTSGVALIGGALTCNSTLNVSGAATMASILGTDAEFGGDVTINGVLIVNQVNISAGTAINAASGTFFVLDNAAVVGPMTISGGTTGQVISVRNDTGGAVSVLPVGGGSLSFPDGDAAIMCYDGAAWNLMGALG